MVSAIILDLAGTTIDENNCMPSMALSNVFKLGDIFVTDRQIGLFMGSKKVDHIKALLNLPDVDEQWFRKHKRPHGPDDYKSMALALDREILAMIHISDSPDLLIEGTLELVNTAKELKIPIGATTGYSSRIMNALLARTKRLGFIPDVAVASDQVEHGRPRPDMIEEVCYQLGVNQHRAVVVDDSTVGIMAGLNAKCWTVQTLCTGSLHTPSIGGKLVPYNSLEVNQQAVLFNSIRDSMSAQQKLIAKYNIPSIKQLPAEIPILQTLIKSGARACMSLAKRSQIL